MGLGALEYLDLCGNKINEIEEGTFEGLESLKTLRLLNNIDDIFSPRNISEDVVTRIKEELALINNLICEIEF
jgi:Leucine-rich repeat (LRR) protein